MRRGTIALLAVVGVAAAAAGVAIATSGDDRSTPPGPLTTGQLAVSRRADPSLDRYTRTRTRRTSRARMTSAQHWLSRRADPLVMHDSDPAVSLNVTGWATDPKVAVYVNATGVNPYRRAQLRGARRWLVRAKGKQVKVDEWWMLDVRQPAARKWWLYGSDGKVGCPRDRDQRAALDLLACGYDALWVDNVLLLPRQWFRPEPSISEASWGEGVVALLSELRDALPDGKRFVINLHWTDSDFGWSPQPVLDPASPFVRAARQADQVVIEGGAIDPGLDYASPTSSQWSYRRLLDYAAAMHAQGARLQWEKTGSNDLTANATAKLGRLPSCRDGDYRRRQPAWSKGSAQWRAHVRTAAFNYASALLAASAGDSVGDMCEYPGRGWAGYGRNLGAPVGAMYANGPLLVREFAHGAVAVNPSSDPATFAVPGGRSASDLASTRWPESTAAVTSLQVAPRAASVLIYR